MVGTLQDQQLAPQGKNLGLQGSASSEAGSESEKHREKKVDIAWAAYTSLPCKLN
jgi:hypothetical protein